MQIAIIQQKIIEFIRSQAGTKKIVLGLSGGIDSAVLAYLLTQALGKDKVFVLLMPSESNSAQDQSLAEAVVKELGIDYQLIIIDKIAASYQESSGMYQDKKTLGNLKARIRMSLLYGKANEIDGLVAGTGNKTELMVGYFTKYGDGGVDFLPLGGLYKTQIRKLAKHLAVPQEIIERPPTASLWAGQTDEDELGVTYQELDKILQALENNQYLTGFSVDKVKLVKKMMQAAKHKQDIPPICFFEGIN